MAFRNDDFEAVLELERQRLAELVQEGAPAVCPECGGTAEVFCVGETGLCHACLAGLAEDYIREAAALALEVHPEEPRRRLAMELLFFILDNLDLNAVLLEFFS